MKRSETVSDLISALCKARSEMQNPVKDKSGYGYKYADLGQLLDICVPILCKHNIFLTQPVNVEDNRVNIETCLMLGNEYISESASYPILQAKGMNEIQCIGSVITYGRRYALSSILGIAQEDSDAAELRGRANVVPEKVITTEQAETIVELAAETETDLSRITSYFKVSGIQNLPESKYEQVMKRLKAARESS